jgi:hypothetical protein
MVLDEPQDYKYWAFISYSHADEEWAQWLHKSLETYRVPKKLVGRQMDVGAVPRRVFPVFRDRDELPGASDLGGNIKQALKQSRYIIVICSPKAAISKWVNEEIKGFKSLDRENRVLCLIVDGEPNAKPDSGQLECFPPAVRFRVTADRELTEEPTEPIAADARKGKDGRANAKLKLLSGILNVGYDELKQREKQRQFYHKLRIGIGVAAFVLTAMIVYLVSADANINVPGGEAVRTFLDRHELSFMRPVHSEAEVRRAAASQRRALVETMRRKIRPEGFIENDFGDREKNTNAWSNSQCMYALFSTPDASNQELRDFLKGLELTFTPGIAIEFNGIKYGWSGETLEQQGNNWRAGSPEDTKAVPTLWTAAALAAAIARPDFLNSEERQRFEQHFAYTQEALKLYKPLETGGWNLYAYQKDPAHYDPYSTTLALLVLLEARRANLPWEGSAERRDALLHSAAQWLVNSYNQKSSPPGWKGTADDVNEVFDGMTLEIYDILLRAEAETGFTIPPVILNQIPRHLAQTVERDLKFPTVKGEQIAAIEDPNTKRSYSKSESVGFLWHPWATDCAARWLKRAEKHGAPKEDIVRVRRALGHLIVDLGTEAVERNAADWSFISAETLYGLSSVPLP